MMNITKNKPPIDYFSSSFICGACHPFTQVRWRHQSLFPSAFFVFHNPVKLKFPNLYFPFYVSKIPTVLFCQRSILIPSPNFCNSHTPSMSFSASYFCGSTSLLPRVFCEEIKQHLLPHGMVDITSQLSIVFFVSNNIDLVS